MRERERERERSSNNKNRIIYMKSYKEMILGSIYLPGSANAPVLD